MKKLIFLCMMLAGASLITQAQYVPTVGTDTIGDIIRVADTRITHWDNLKFQMTIKTHEYRNGVEYLPMRQEPGRD